MPKRKIVQFVILFLVLWVVIYGLLTFRHGFSARDNPSRQETLIARVARRLAVPAGAKRQQNPFRATPELLAEARAHFADHCAICHANDGGGNTEIGQNLYPKAPDMRLPATQNLSDGELYYTVHNGIRMTGMPAWGSGDKDDDSWKLVLFIRHLPQLTAEEEEEVKRLYPKSLEELKETQEEEQFLNEGQSRNQADQPTHHNRRGDERP
jgi:mono/diheme cytochrome c family protein